MKLTLSQFFFDIPIYNNIIIDEENFQTFIKIIESNKEEFEGYNPWQKVESTFVVITNLQPRDSSFENQGGFRAINIKCKRTDNIFWYFIYYEAFSKTLTKIGQYPSIADFHISEINHYSKLLSKDKLKEFTRAIGLAANGVGIGSFVYLRRIFEFLIYEAFNKAKNEGTVNESDFKRARMDEKINLLHLYLPSFLVENKTMYSILSKGLHELDEQTCLAHFDTLRVGIEIILDEQLDELKKKEKIEHAKQKLALVQGQLKK